MNAAIKVFLSLLFLLCLLDLPYGYFQLVRFAAFVGFAILAYNAIEHGHKGDIIIYVSLAILFQPLIKIALGRDLWNIIDVIVSAGLIISIFIKPSDR